MPLFIGTGPPSHVPPSDSHCIKNFGYAAAQRHYCSPFCSSSMEEEEAQRRRSSSASSSPEFEFWMLRNPSFPQPELLTADELIVDGVVLPLHLLSLQRSCASVQPSPEPPPVHPPADPPPASVLASASFSAAPASGSRRWKDIFKVVGEKKPEEKDKDKERKERRSSVGGSASAELNINLNIWPFSRSHSASNPSVRPRPSASIASRKVSSAPCSRSNSRGESSTAGGGGRKWASSPARGGVHLGRSTSVWKLRRTGMGPKDKARNSNADALPAPCVAGNSGGEGGGGVRLLNLNVNSCIGYQNQVSCRDDHSDALTGRACTAEGSGSNGSIFKIRALFSKKVY